MIDIDEELFRLSQNLGEILVKNGYTIATAESITGGYIAKVLTDVPGSSRYFKGSIISYATEVKEKVLGVSGRTVKVFGVVSEEVAREMVQGLVRLMEVDVGISITGEAGPITSTGIPPGTFCSAFYIKGKIISFTESIKPEGDVEILQRNSVRREAVKRVLTRLINILEGGS